MHSLSQIGSASKNGILVFLILIIVTAAGWFYYSSQRIKDEVRAFAFNPSTADQLSQEEIDSLTAAVSSHIIINDSAQPLIATVQDFAALASQNNFFEKAQDGDTVFVYSTRAILFRKSEDRIINVGPVFIQPSENETQ